MPFLRTIQKKDSFAEHAEGFPFSLPIFARLDEMDLSRSVTFFVGENGSGKSTLLEAIGVALGAIVVGSESTQVDASLEPARALARHLQIARDKNPNRGFLFRAEDFFGFVKGVKQSMGEFEELEAHYDRTLTGYGRDLAMGVARKSRHGLSSRYGENPHAFSHGESFLNLFESRLVPDGLYLLDEPETPLSPLRQLSFLSLVKEMTERGCQFIIATHSPIIMAFPEARILNFDHSPPLAIKYEDVEHVSLTKAFLNDPEGFLRRL